MIIRNMNIVATTGMTPAEIASAPEPARDRSTASSDGQRGDQSDPDSPGERRRRQ